MIDRPRPGSAYCAIDFGTSNSAVAVPAENGRDAATPMRLVPLEDGQETIPSAVFYDSETSQRRYGRSAIDAYIDGHDGRLMRSLKSILGSALIDETTHMGDGMSLRYIDVIAGFLNHLKRSAEALLGSALKQVVLGRPVYFVDDDSAADARAEAALRGAANAVGFEDVSFQFEPIAAALDYEQRLTSQQLVLVADIGGGTSDFTVIRLGGTPATERDRDVLASHGVHVAGTDFDQRVELDAILPHLGFRSQTPEGREVPNRIYYDLATWHLINGVYAPRRIAELRAMKPFYAERIYHERLLKTAEQRLGHRLMGRAEAAKIELSEQRSITLALSEIEPGLVAHFDQLQLAKSLEVPVARVVEAARETIRRAQLQEHDIKALYFTGGSTGLRLLSEGLAAAFPAAERVFGNRFASVASGLGLQARQRYGQGAG